MRDLAPREDPHKDTIFALASGAGRAGVAVVRISGPAAGAAARDITRTELPKPRTAVVRTLFDEKTDERIDVGLLLWFPAPDSYTGENIVEIQSHGGKAVVGKLLATLAGRPGLRLADAGEFTRRAVENGKLDLLQAEAIADLVDAETEGQRRQALRQFGGTLSALYEEWRAQLIRAAAWVEAVIDFPDEDVPEQSLADARAGLQLLLEDIRQHLDDGRRGEILRDGLKVAVVGPVNAGKSSLVNALARRDAVIVSDIPGTTRDVVEVRLDLGGYPVILSDTAGFRESDDPIEREGVRRARATAQAADVRLLVLDASCVAEAGSWILELNPDLIVWNKADQVRHSGLAISAQTGEGLPELVEQLASFAQAGLAGEAPVLTRARHRTALEDAKASLEAALEISAAEQELVAENLRRAMTAIGRITGRVDLDDLLDVVFRDFCIGK